MINITFLKRLAITMCVLVAFPLSDALSQDFIMQTENATYNATCGGVIKMKKAGTANPVPGPGVAGKFDIKDNNKLGSEDNPISGIVEWAASSDQTIQALFYEKMLLSGGNKTIPTGVNIVGIACDLADLLPGYDDFATYPFVVENPTTTTNNFGGDFTYSGPGVIIFPVTGNDAYDNLVLDGAGPFTILDNETTEVKDTLRLDATGVLDVDGDLVLGSGNSNLLGTTTIDNGGSIQVGGGDLTFSGNITVTDGTLNGGVGEITIGEDSKLALDTDGVLDLDGGEVINITGEISNIGDGTNLALECTSIVNYNGGAEQLVLPTLASNPYGILNLSGGEKWGGAAFYTNNIEVCEDFDLSGGNLVMTHTDPDAFLNIHKVASNNVTYDATSEVIGKFRRNLLDPDGITTANGITLTYNNENTNFTITGGTPLVNNFYELDINKGKSPETYVANTDVNRKYTATYSLADNFEYKLQLGYLTGELPVTYDGTLTEQDLKFYEANAADGSEKVAGTGYLRNQDDNFRWVSLAGILTGTAPIDETIDKVVANGNDIVLRANNKMYSILAGRWTNPNVWDEGRQPNENDNVELRHLVYVGIDGPFAGTTGGGDGVAENNTLSENTHYGMTGGGEYNPVANTITIGNYANAALVIGNEDNAAGYVFRTAKTDGTSFFNNNTNLANFGTLTGFADKSAGGIAAAVNGLWLTSFITPDDNKLPGAPGVVMFGTNQIDNSGSIANEGIIEVGQ